MVLAELLLVAEAGLAPSLHVRDDRGQRREQLQVCPEERAGDCVVANADVFRLFLLFVFILEPHVDALI